MPPHDAHARFEHVVTLYVAPDQAPVGDRGLLGDSPEDLHRVVKAWQNTLYRPAERRAAHRRPRLRGLLEGVRPPRP